MKFSPIFFLLCAVVSAKTFADAPLTASEKAAKASPKLVISTVLVKDENNPPDLLGGMSMNHYPYGSVTSAFHMGTYDTTASEYMRFLNSVASSSDPNQLYDERMGSDVNVATIKREVREGNYLYSLQGLTWETGRLPIVYVSWFSAARFCNWLHNGQPVGPQGINTTETGVYNLAAPVVIKNVPLYCNFLNAVATTDTYALYESSVIPFINQQGTPGNYSYVPTDRGNEAGASFGVTWNSAARFANWKYNASLNLKYSPTPRTEDGIYVIKNGIKDIVGDTDIAPTDYCSVAEGAKYFLPTENQYYKTAFYKKNRDTSNQLTSEYWTYPTLSDTPPGNNRHSPCSANYYVASNEDYSKTGWLDRSNYKFGNNGSAPFITAVGAYSLSPSPYGAFDMGGNVSQWLNGPAGQASTVRPIRGGAWGTLNQWPVGPDQLSKDKGAASIDSSAKRDYIGFRVATP